MEQQDKTATQGGIKPAEVITIIFRRKWLILLCTFLGIAAAAGFYFLVPPSYSSEARLFIRYVLEKPMPVGAESETQIMRPDAQGNNIVASEVQLMSSFDLALQVAESVGPAKILAAKPGEPADRTEAAALIRKNLAIEVPPRSDVVRLTFAHSDPTIVQSVLSGLISGYIRKHDEIHRAAGMFDEVLTQQTDTLRVQLAQTEDDLRKLRLKIGVSSMEETKRAYTEELSRIRQEINNTQASIAEQKASLNLMLQSLGKTGAETNSTDAVVQAQAPSAKIDEYRSITARLDYLRRREQELLTLFTPENLLVKSIRNQVGEAEKTQKALETEFPNLKNTPAASPERAGNQPAQTFNPALEQARLAAMEAKFSMLQTQLQKINGEIASINDIEPELVRLERKKELEEKQYRHFLTSLEQARFEDALGAGRSSNIGVAQSPSAPFRESRKMMKTLGMLLAAGIGLGFGLAFALEMYLAPTIKSTDELQRRFRGSVLLSIPALARNGKVHPRALLPNAPSGSETGAHEKVDGSEIVQWHPSNHFQPYYEGLRDRIMTWFENRNLTHKPKLVAVTGCQEGSGVSSIAAGLAATFSETGDGRVLLVDMNVGQGAAHYFYKGKPGVDLDGALTHENREEAQVTDNLYVVTEGSSNRDRLPSVLPRRFTSLVPKLKASDFDYIIFDMPPVTPITMTPRLAAYMDMVLMVVEAEKTSPEALKQANDLLAQSKANVAAVLNKTQDHGPKFLKT